jgi:hypothetical protein
MADSDKDILITPNVGVATNLPEIKFVGKDNSPMYLKVLDDNALSFEGTEGQVFSMSPTMSSGDIFSVSDISGVQSMAVNADGTIKIIPSGTTPSSNLYLGDLRHCFVYARGTGNNNAANSLIYLNGKKIIDNNVRGMYLTILNQIDLSVVSSTRYDTYSGGTTNVNNLATAIGNMTDQQIGILVSEDAWEPNSSNGANLWAAAKLVGLTKLGHYDGGDGSVRRPYAAIFMGSGDDANAANKFVIERMSDADADAPMASVSAILVSDGVHASISGAQYQNALWSSDSNHEEPALIVDEDKHVGINTVTPVRPLHVTGDAYVQNGDILLSRGNYYLQDASDATNRGSFTSDGVWAWENVIIGIGTTSPDTTNNAKLHVRGSGIQNIKVESTDSSAGIILMSDSADNWLMYSPNGSDDLRFYTDAGTDADVMTLEGTNKRVGIGTTTPGALLEIKEGGNGAAIMRFRNTNTSFPNDTAFATLEFYNADASGAGVTSKINAISDASGRGGQLQFQVDDTGTSPQTALLLQGDLNAVFAGGIETTSSTNGWNTWSMMRFGKLDYGTAASGGSGLNGLTFDDNEAGFTSIVIPTNITIRAVQIRTNGVVLANSANKADPQVMRIFANGDAGSGTLTNINYDMEDFTRQNSENANATAHYYTVTGLSATYNAGDTMSVRRESGGYDMGDVIVDIYYSMSI